MSVGDIICLFESSYSDYQQYTPPTWTEDQPASKIYHIVYGVTQDDLTAVLEKAACLNAGYVYVTQLSGSNPYSTLPSYWMHEITDIQSILCNISSYTCNTNYSQPTSGTQAILNSSQATSALVLLEMCISMLFLI